MSRTADEKRILELRRELERHNHLYYVDAQPEITDRDYDLQYRELQDLEARHPDLITTASPTQRVGGEPIKEFQRVAHRAPMLSLEKKEDLRELELFEKEIRKSVPDFKPDYVVEPKIDGVSISLHYVDGLLTQGLTRGDGEFGDDITVNLRTIREIPLRLNTTEKPPRHLEVRGEAYMREADRIALNEKLRARGDKTFANTRNATAGSLKQLDPRIVAERPIRAVFYALGYLEGVSFASHTDELAALQGYGLPVPEAWRRADSLVAAEAQARTMKAEEGELPYEIDGCVIKVNDNEVCRTLGLKTNVPAYAVAYKRPEWFNEATTKLLRVVVQVGRTGVLAPVAEVEPVFLDGTTISRITLHNADEIKRKDIRIGDTVVIKRAGRVIPAVVRVVDDQRTGREMPFNFPSTCPACGAPVEQLAQIAGKGLQTAIRCTSLTCPAQVTGRLKYLASRSVLDIEGLGEVVAERLVEAGLIKTPLDLFQLKREQLAALNLGVSGRPVMLGELRADTILSGIERARFAPLELWIKAIGIASVGEEAARLLAKRFESIRSLAESELLPLVAELKRKIRIRIEISPFSKTNRPRDEHDKLTRTSLNSQLKNEIAELQTKVDALGGGDGIDHPVAEGVTAYFRSSAGKMFLEQFQKLGINPSKRGVEPLVHINTALSGKKVAVTGTFSDFTRDQIKVILRAQGATIVSSVTKNTDILICGSIDGSSKLDAAKAYGVLILDEAAFRKTISKIPTDSTGAVSQGTLEI